MFGGVRDNTFIIISLFLKLHILFFNFNTFYFLFFLLEMTLIFKNIFIHSTNSMECLSCARLCAIQQEHNEKKTGQVSSHMQKIYPRGIFMKKKYTLEGKLKVNNLILKHIISPVLSVVRNKYQMV